MCSILREIHDMGRHQVGTNNILPNVNTCVIVCVFCFYFQSMSLPFYLVIDLYATYIVPGILKVEV